MHRLRHRRVVKLLGVILEEGNYSLVMEYMEKGNLMHVLKAEVSALRGLLSPGAWPPPPPTPAPLLGPVAAAFGQPPASSSSAAGDSPSPRARRL